MARFRKLRAVAFVSFAFVLGACGAGPGGQSEEPSTAGEGSAHDTEGAETPTDDSTTTAQPDARPLGISATFGDLVSAAQRLDDTSQGDATSGCILRGTGPFRLESDLSVAIRPMPEAPPDLDARMAGVTHVRALSRWGQLGADGELAIVTFTTTPPPRADNGLAIVLTDRGAYLRPIGTAPISVAGPMPPLDAARVLMDATMQLGVVAVVAESGVAVTTLRALLAALPGDGTVALGVTLAEGVRLPEPRARADDPRGACPDGLPPLVGTEGELDAPAILGALGPLRDAARGCLASAQGAAANGGRISVAFRIGPDGRVAEACAPFDDVGDADLRACVLDAARATQFPAPHGPGSVDALLPLVLTPDTSFVQRPLCEPAR